MTKTTLNLETTPTSTYKPEKTSYYILKLDDNLYSYRYTKYYYGLSKVIECTIKSSSNIEFFSLDDCKELDKLAEFLAFMNTNGDLIIKHLEIKCFNNKYSLRCGYNKFAITIIDSYDGFTLNTSDRNLYLDLDNPNEMKKFYDNILTIYKKD